MTFKGEVPPAWKPLIAGEPYEYLESGLMVLKDGLAWTENDEWSHYSMFGPACDGTIYDEGAIKGPRCVVKNKGWSEAEKKVFDGAKVVRVEKRTTVKILEG